LWQSVDEINYQIEIGLFVLPRIVPMLAEQWIRRDDNDHIELAHQDNLLPTMSPAEVETMVACPGGPPLITIIDGFEVAAYPVIPGILS